MPDEIRRRHKIARRLARKKKAAKMTASPQPVAATAASAMEVSSCCDAPLRYTYTEAETGRILASTDKPLSRRAELALLDRLAARPPAVQLDS